MLWKNGSVALGGGRPATQVQSWCHSEKARESYPGEKAAEKIATIKPVHTPWVMRRARSRKFLRKEAGAETILCSREPKPRGTPSRSAIMRIDRQGGNSSSRTSSVAPDDSRNRGKRFDECSDSGRRRTYRHSWLDKAAQRGRRADILCLSGRFNVKVTATDALRREGRRRRWGSRGS